MKIINNLYKKQLYLLIFTVLCLTNILISCKPTVIMSNTIDTYELTDAILDDFMVYATTDLEKLYYDLIINKLDILVVNKHITPEFRLMTIDEMIIILEKEESLEYIWNHFWDYILYEGSDYEFFY